MNINIFYYKNGDVYQLYLVPNNYCKTLGYIKSILEFAKTINCTLPNEDEIRINTLRGVRYNGMLSVEFCSITKPNKGMELERGSGIWEWLVT